MSSITTTTDPTPLTEAEIQRIAELEAKATPERWTVENGWSGTNTNRFLVRGKGTDGIHFGQSPRDISDIDLIAALRNAAPALLAAARENAGLREERDDRIRANVRLCEEIKNYRAERDMAQLELSRANVRYEQSHRRAEAMWKERDAALARVAELERKCKLAVEFIEDSSEADCAYPSDPCLRVHISELGHGMCDGCKARRALGYINAPAVFLPDTKETPQ